MKKDKLIYESVLELIGATPLVKLNRIVDHIPGTFIAKLECFNPGHSSKDRIALHIIEEAEKKGLLKPGDTIIETTSGNTGFSLAMVNIVKGYKCVLAVSSKSSLDKIDMLKSMGAKVYICPAHVEPDDPRSYYEVAKRLHKETKDSVYINQYFNSLNTEAHYQTTGPEIWKQTQGQITHLVACSGTGGTISGTAKYLKEQNPAIKIIGVDAYGSVLKSYHENRVLDGNEIYPYRIEGLGKNLIPSTTNFDIIDEFIKVSDEDSAHSARKLSTKEGLFVGYTSGAAIQAVKQLNEKKTFKSDDIVVVIFPDHGSRYMSKIYNVQWMNDQGFFDNQTNVNSNSIEFTN